MAYSNEADGMKTTARLSACNDLVSEPQIVADVQ